MAIEQEVKIVGKNIADDTLQSNTDSFEENYLKELNDQFLQKSSDEIKKKSNMIFDMNNRNIGVN